MGTYAVLVERTIVDQYLVEADSVIDANEKFNAMIQDGPWPIPSISEELEVEVRDEETFLVSESSLVIR